MSMDLFVARTMTTKASLVYRGSINITESQVGSRVPYWSFVGFKMMYCLDFQTDNLANLQFLVVYSWHPLKVFM
jgi:hypothetical protein